MKNPFQMLLARRKLSDVLMAFSDVRDDEIARAQSQLSKDESAKVLDLLGHQLQSVGVKSTLYIGGIFFLAKLLADPHDKNETEKKLLMESGISKGHACRCLRVFVRFNRVFQSNENISKQFGSESLKILSEEGASDESRSEAIRLAKTGTRISVKLAKELRYKFPVPTPVAVVESGAPHELSKANSPPIVDAASAKDSGSQRNAIAEPSCNRANSTLSKTKSDNAIIFEGLGFRLVVNSEMKADTESELIRIVRELETFLSQLRAQCGRVSDIDQEQLNESIEANNHV